MCRLALGIKCGAVRSGTQRFGTLSGRELSTVLMGGPSVVELKQHLAVHPSLHPKCHLVGSDGPSPVTSV